MTGPSTGRASRRRRWPVLLLWVLAVGALTAAFPAHYSQDLEVPGESGRALRLLRERFGAAEAGDAVVVVVQADKGVRHLSVQRQVTDLLGRAAALPHVQAVRSPYSDAGQVQIAPDGSVALATLQLDVRGFDVPAELLADLRRLVDQARQPGLQVELGGQAVQLAEGGEGGGAEAIGLAAAAIILPAALDGSGAAAQVGGAVAASVDGADRMAERLPWLFATVIGVSLVLLLVSFRSLLLPLKAAALNLLSIAAGFGAVVAVFQWGWGIELLGLDRGAPIDPVLPMLLFAIVFGLSMDYEVFLLSRVREAWARTGDNTRAVDLGVGATARVITAAGAVMIAVFATFMLGPDRLIKLFGFALAVPVLVDIVLIRLVLAPAAMALFGRANWYLPRWLDRLLPTVRLEGDLPQQAQPTAREVAGAGHAAPR
jgi:uncharacterized membrane protein YdfJ with MMPL/SSD domain